MILLTVALIIIFALILLIDAFLITPLQFGLEIVKTAHKNKTHLYFRLFGVPIKIPLKPEAKSENKNQKTKQRKESPLSFENFKENISDFKETYETSKADLKDMLSYVRHHISV